MASSWSNPIQQVVVRVLQDAGHKVYDFRDPEHAFHWKDISSHFQEWTSRDVIKIMDFPAVARGFLKDISALYDADITVLVEPCGRSAHLEAGWVAGQGKTLIILLDESKGQPEVMYAMAHYLVLDFDELLEAVRDSIEKRRVLARG